MVICSPYHRHHPIQTFAHHASTAKARHKHPCTPCTHLLCREHGKVVWEGEGRAPGAQVHLVPLALGQPGPAPGVRPLPRTVTTRRRGLGAGKWRGGGGGRGAGPFQAEQAQCAGPVRGHHPPSTIAATAPGGRAQRSRSVAQLGVWPGPGPAAFSPAASRRARGWGGGHDTALVGRGRWGGHDPRAAGRGHC